MSVLIVASDRAGAGKTASALGLAELGARRGANAVALNPFADGESAPPADWRGALGEAAANGGDADVIIETPSSFGVRGVADAADALDARALVVAGYRRDLDGADFAEWREALGDRLAGVLVNGVTRYLGNEAKTRLAPSLTAAGVRCLGMIPEDRLMLSATVDEIRAALGGRYAVEEGDVHSPIERFQAGVLSLDPARLRLALYENNAVVVRGDRPDIQMSALEADIACLILTCGIDPIEYIAYEASEEETPVMVVETDTLATMDALNGATSNPTAAAPYKAARFADLLQAHADLEALRTA